jgi:hypothetical protein
MKDRKTGKMHFQPVNEQEKKDRQARMPIPHQDRQASSLSGFLASSRQAGCTTKGKQE